MIVRYILVFHFSILMRLIWFVVVTAGTLGGLGEVEKDAVRGRDTSLERIQKPVRVYNCAVLGAVQRELHEFNGPKAIYFGKRRMARITAHRRDMVSMKNNSMQNPVLIWGH
jgi:hypothetical protein